MTVLEARDLEVSIAGVQVCRHLDLGLKPGQCWGILGRNGVGKTTLVHTLAGIRAPAGGRILLQGVDLSTLSRRRIAQRVAVLFQEHADIFPSTVLETALIGRHPHLRPWTWEGAEDIRIARQALSDMDIATLEKRTVATLSGGERRRLELAAVLTQEPCLFLLDEPTNHLDLHHQEAVLKCLTALCRGAGRTVVMTLHDVNLGVRYCDHLLLIFGTGETLAGPTNEVMTEDTLTRLYRHPIHRFLSPERSFYFPE